ncbi:hypothetical protein EMPS_05363 [Entomortierella parvispora]|uniref:Uncharacterized protein n=1 Tax=Entomortierella parvispora TaxID=205924 RepID=A0A9P3HA99_9FUNG|nr:hypothetical protein EMPS_05363 [Entomortierella parvispora]
MTTVHLLETILYDPNDGGVFLEDYHFDRMLSSAKELAPSYALDKEKFLQELIPTPSELSHKLEGAINNGGKDKRQRLRVLLDFEGDVTIQSSQLPSETKSFAVDGPIIVVLDSEPTLKDNIWLYHKTTQREVYNAARTRQGLGPVGAPVEANAPFDVLMYNEDNEIMETSIANIAIEVENPETGKLEWVTPPAASGLLCGTMRRKLLEEGKIHERVITVEELKRAALANKKMKCFNSVRMEYPVSVKF